jgi:hypothetical protein
VAVIEATQLSANLVHKFERAEAAVRENTDVITDTYATSDTFTIQSDARSATTGARLRNNRPALLVGVRKA